MNAPMAQETLTYPGLLFLPPTPHVRHLIPPPLMSPSSPLIFGLVLTVGCLALGCVISSSLDPNEQENT
jgi:hypothetical protein